MSIRISPVAKAVVGALAAGSAAAVPVISDGVLDLAEAVLIVAAVLGSFGIVWAVPNKP